MTNDFLEKVRLNADSVEIVLEAAHEVIEAARVLADQVPPEALIHEKLRKYDFLMKAVRAQSNER